MNTCLDNLINGNLADARAQARRYGLFDLACTLRNSYGFTRNRAIMAASYLKGRCTFQAYCDAV